LWFRRPGTIAKAHGTNLEAQACLRPAKGRMAQVQLGRGVEAFGCKVDISSEEQRFCDCIVPAIPIAVIGKDSRE